MRLESLEPWLTQSAFWNWIQAAAQRLRNGMVRRSPVLVSSRRLSSRTLTGSVAGSSGGWIPASPRSSPTLRKKRVYAAPTIGS